MEGVHAIMGLLWSRSRRRPTALGVVVVLSLLCLLGGWTLAARNRVRARPRASQFATRVVDNGMSVPFFISGRDILSRPYAKRIIVSERNGFVYCPVPKVASSNWKYLIRKHEGFADYDDLAKAHSPLTSGLRYLSDYSPAEVEHILYRSGFFKFVFVRDPYSRLLSCYVDKLVTKYANETDEYRTWLGQVYDWKYVRERDILSEPRPSFRGFVDELLKQDPDRMNEHWMPQAYVCGFGEVPYDFVGRFEQLSSDAKLAIEQLQFHDAFPSQEQIGFHPTGSSQLAPELYTLELMLKTRILYDVDFTILGY